MLLASYVFYGWWDWRFLSLIMFCTVVNHVAACLLAGRLFQHQKKWILILAVTANLGVLGFFKYYGFFIMSAYELFAWLGLSMQIPLLDVILPVGISFFTFQAMSYVMDVYRGDLRPSRNILEFATYLAFFPQLVAGPIIRASVFLPQLRALSKKPTIDIGRATTLILGGLFKKIVLANSLALILVDPVFADPDMAGGFEILIAVYAYAAQIYCDFSAYSDIAIGLALLLGIRFPDNFNAPYIAARFQEFWQRWHISLSTWLRDYLYIPMGGSRCGKGATYRNLAITFLLGGLWHGAQWRFVAWGALHGIYLIIEKTLTAIWPERVPDNRYGRWLYKCAAVMLVFHGVCLSWIFFRAETFDDALILIRHLARPGGSVIPLAPALWLLPLAFGVQWFDGCRLKPIWDWFDRLGFLLQGLIAAIIITIILALGPQGVAPFIYFQF